MGMCFGNGFDKLSKILSNIQYKVPWPLHTSHFSQCSDSKIPNILKYHYKLLFLLLLILRHHYPKQDKMEQALELHLVAQGDLDYHTSIIKLQDCFWDSILHLLMTLYIASLTTQKNPQKNEQNAYLYVQIIPQGHPSNSLEAKI